MKINRLLIALLLLTTACSLPFGANPVPGETAVPTVAPSLDAPQVDQATPVPQPINTSVVQHPQFASFQMLTELDGWGVTDSAILRTNDGGITWYDVTPSGGPNLGYNVGATFMDASRAYVIAPDASNPMNAGTLYRTVDGGLTWSFNTIPFGGARLRFLDAKNAWAMADLGAGAGSNAIAIYQSTDGGANWTRTFVNDPNAEGASDGIPLGGLKSTFFARDMQTAWVGGVVYSDATVYLFRTDDGGHTWDQVPLTLPTGTANTQLSIENIQFPTPTDGFLSMSIPGDTNNRAIYVTHDAGDTWMLTPTLIPNGRVTDFVSAADGFVFNGDQFYVTHDAGQTWTTVAPDVVFGESFINMDFVNATTGWVTTSDPSTFEISMYKTTDGGATWIPQ